ncbi:NADP-dependent oxidoreductase [Deinococcus hohokamensis]|uniref:NADP-dependent oxidoreductase n=1 Tax=Deinococcus hohokamensis TaxID=309883 RepID=A0ABV9I7C5_9DEIO
MRRAVMSAFGDPSVLRIQETDWPSPVRDELLIQVHASSVNGTDLGIRAGRGPFRLVTRLPYTPGFDVAGTVVRCGPHVTAFNPGDPVFALLGHGGGGAADYVTVRQSRVARAPASVPLTQAAAVPLAGLTALQGLRRGGALHLLRGARVLIIGASGGIGSFGVQLAKVYGAHVTGVARAEKHGYVRSLGADHVLLNEDLQNEPGVWDIILDAAPVLKLSKAQPLLSPEGMLVSVRAFPTEWPEVAALGGRRKPGFHGIQTRERGQDLAFLAALIDGGQVRIPMDRIYPLEQIAAAHRYAEGSDVRGKVVVSC